MLKTRVLFKAWKISVDKSTKIQKEGCVTLGGPISDRVESFFSCSFHEAQKQFGLAEIWTADLPVDVRTRYL